MNRCGSMPVNRCQNLIPTGVLADRLTGDLMLPKKSAMLALRAALPARSAMSSSSRICKVST